MNTRIFFSVGGDGMFKTTKGCSQFGPDIVILYYFFLFDAATMHWRITHLWCYVQQTKAPPPLLLKLYIFLYTYIQFGPLTDYHTNVVYVSPQYNSTYRLVIENIIWNVACHQYRYTIILFYRGNVLKRNTDARATSQNRVVLVRIVQLGPVVGKQLQIGQSTPEKV